LLLLVAPATKQHSSFFYYIKCSKQYHIVLWLTHYYYCFPLPHQAGEHRNEIETALTTLMSCRAHIRIQFYTQNRKKKGRRERRPCVYRISCHDRAQARPNIKEEEDQVCAPI
jgi:hypothetical protein